MDAAFIKSSLKNFTDKTKCHQHWSGIRFTDGVHFLAENAQAYWLIDLLGSWQREALRDSSLQEFQLWELFVRQDRTATIVCSRDSEDKAFHQDIEYTDFPLDYLRLYIEGGVALLPSEH